MRKTVRADEARKNQGWRPTLKGEFQMIKDIVEGKTVEEVAQALYLDGFTGGIDAVREIVDMVEAGKGEEASQVAHLDGWL